MVKKHSAHCVATIICPSKPIESSELRKIGGKLKNNKGIPLKHFGQKLLFYLGLSILGWGNAYGARHALLVGVSHYPIVEDLHGPKYDVAAVKSVLIKHWGFKESHIEILLDQGATKKNILEAISALKSRSAVGDQLFVYLSGHGTSAGDGDMGTPLPTTTGAYIPYDIEGVASAEQLMDRLIIGQRDLQPIFKGIDASGRPMFVVIDACYSGNTVRGQYSNTVLPKRFVRLSDLLPSRAAKNSGYSKALQKNSTQAPQRYPYNNIYYLAASGEYEPAQDIPPNMIAQYPTFDGNPHGAFTDSLLHVLSGKINADLDANGVITYGELQSRVQRLMRDRGFSHTPQGLPDVQEDHLLLAERALFSRGLSLQSPDTTVDTSSEAQSSTSPSQRLEPLEAVESVLFSVQLSPALEYLQQAIKRQLGIKVVQHRAMINLRGDQSSQLLLISASGDLVETLSKPSDAEVLQAISRQKGVHRLLNAPFAQDFSLQLSYDKIGVGSIALQGDVIGFNYRASRGAYLLLVDINPKGEITVLHPTNQNQLNPIKANRLKSLNKIALVGPPYGRDFIVAYALAGYQEELSLIAGKTFSPGSPLMVHFLKLVSARDVPKARAVLELITAEKTPNNNPREIAKK